MINEEPDPNTKKLLDHLHSRGYQLRAIEKNGKTFFPNPVSWADKANNFIESQPRFRLPLIILGLFLLIFIINYGNNTVFLYQHKLLTHFSVKEQLGGIIYRIGFYWGCLILLLLSTYCAIKVSTYSTTTMGERPSVVPTVMLALLLSFAAFLTKDAYQVATNDGYHNRFSTRASDDLKRHALLMEDLKHGNVSDGVIIYYKPVFSTYNKIAITRDEQSKRYYIISKDPDNYGRLDKLLAVVNKDQVAGY